jgi:hypothetical protein
MTGQDIMKTIGIIPNLYKDPELNITKDIIDILIKYECNPVIPEHVANKSAYSDYAMDYEGLYRHIYGVIYDSSLYGTIGSFFAGVKGPYLSCYGY